MNDSETDAAATDDGPLVAAGPGCLVNPEFADRLRAAGLDSADALLDPTLGETLRTLPDRSNVRLDAETPDGPWRLFLKRHVGARGKGRTPAAGEAEMACLLTAAGVPTLTVVAVAERAEPDGTRSSVFVSEDLTGYRQLDELIPERFPDAKPGDRALDPLITELGRVAGAFHAAGGPTFEVGLRHRDFYTCHFFARERAADEGGGWSVRLIDLQRVFRPHTWTARRWRVKDLAQLLYSRPPAVGCRGTGRFLRAYLGGPALRPERRMLAAAVRKAARLRKKHGPYRPGW